MNKEELLKAIAEGKDYSYIATNYSTMSKSELADVYKELTYSIYSFLSADEYKRFLAYYGETLKDRISED